MTRGASSARSVVTCVNAAIVAALAAGLPGRRPRGANHLLSQLHVYKDVDGCPLLIEAHVPENTAKARPALVWIHGGALIMGHRQVPDSHAAVYNAAGYVVVSPDYRLAPEVTVKEVLDDVRDAYSWMRTQGPDLLGIDPSRIAVMGHSAGGYLSLMCGSFLQPRPKAIVSYYGYGDIAAPWIAKASAFHKSQIPDVPRDRALRAVKKHKVMLDGRVTGRGDFYHYCRQQGVWTREVTGYDVNVAPEKVSAYCPNRHIDRDFSPTILLHGDQDTDVPYEQSVETCEHLKTHLVEHEFISLPGQEHGFPVTPELFTSVTAFLDVHV